MRRDFWKGTLISIGAYTAAVCLGFLVDFRLTLFLVPALSVTWTLFCTIRAIQLRLRGAQKATAPSADRESYAFALGGSMSSIVSLLTVVILSQSA
jgi:hypothetical protein